MNPFTKLFNFGKVENLPTPQNIYSSPLVEPPKRHEFYLGYGADYLQTVGAQFMDQERPNLPYVFEVERAPWISFGLWNNYPDILIRNLETCALHNAIIHNKFLLTYGKGFFIDGVDIDTWMSQSPANKLSEIATFFRNPNGKAGDSLNDILEKVVMDYLVYGAFTLEIHYDAKFTKIASIDWLPVSKFRSGKMNERNQVNEAYFFHDWVSLQNRSSSDLQGKKPACIQMFDPTCITGISFPTKGSMANKLAPERQQCLYVAKYFPDKAYYGVPSYVGAMEWIEVASQLALYNNRQLRNGFRPSQHIKFYTEPGTVEEKNNEHRKIMQNFAGGFNAGRPFITFSRGKDLSPDIVPIEVKDTDKQLPIIMDQANQNILSGHGVTSPELLGISVPGKLGNTDMSLAYDIFKTEKIVPVQQLMIKTFKKIAYYAGLGDINLTIGDLNPMGTKYNPNMVDSKGDTAGNAPEFEPSNK